MDNSLYFDQIASTMFEKKVVHIDFENQYVLSSGIKLPFYIEVSTLFSDPDDIGIVCNAFQLWISEHCRREKTNIDIYVGTEKGGITWVTSITQRRCMKMAYVYDRPKSYGLRNQISAELPFDGANAIVIDDAITTGFSAIEAVKALRKGENGKKANVLGVFTLFDWNFPEVNQKFEELGIRKECLVSVDKLLEYGVTEGYIDVATYNRLLEFYQNYGK